MGRRRRGTIAVLRGVEELEVEVERRGTCFEVESVE